MRWRFLCLFGLLSVLVPGSASGSAASAAPDPSCSFRAQATVGFGATVCERTTGAQGMEPMLAVNRRGTLFMGIATDKGLYEDPGRLTGTAENALLRSRNDGRTWQRIPLPGGIDASEGFPYIDPAHRPAVRHVALRRRDPLRPAGDPQRRRGRDTGPRRPTARDARRRRAGDWPKIFAGPHKGKAPGGYPDAVYVCNFIPNILVAASIGCWRSDDGGDHFEFSELPADGQRRLYGPGMSRAAPARRSSTAAGGCSPTGTSSSR